MQDQAIASATAARAIGPGALVRILKIRVPPFRPTLKSAGKTLLKEASVTREVLL
ncbi:hypothetical protein AAF712_012913 [Marasmius tenuissimus]|uniref:Uncharacterized protein n=1 Tax=Marasmius tenuissimus TaxID=585030 RepID=A0ABR2ZGE4_9AGAR